MSPNELEEGNHGSLGIYAKAVTADKRQAQNIIAALFMDGSNQSPQNTAAA